MSKHLLSKVVFIAMMFSFSVAHAAKPKDQRKELQQQNERVTKVLRGEAMGSKLDRQQYFEPTLASDVVADEVYWQAGHVRQGERWIPHDKLNWTSQQQQTLSEYAQHREKFWGNDEEHLQIARWCIEKGLHEQARAHLLAVLLKHPDHPQLRQALGYQRISGQWMNAEEYASLQRNAERQQARFQEWTPKILEIRNNLNSSNPRQHRSGLSALSSITTADAVPALETILLTHSRDCARVGVEQLSEIHHRDSTLALCRVALSSPWTDVKLQATESLKARSCDDYVGELLLQTRSEITMSVQLATSSFISSLRARRIAVYDSFELTVNSSAEGIYTNDVVLKSLSGTPVFGLVPDGSPRAVDVQYLSTQIQLSINEFLVDAVQTQGAQNAEIQDSNRDIFDLLRHTTNQDLNNDPQLWWNWWNQHLEQDVIAKSTRIVEVSEEEPLPIWILSTSCFTAGTPVWSEFGSRPIESLKVGDRVLTKHVETGELTYRPVIRTTYRETNRPLIRIQLDSEKITATGGHLFWVSGSGWKKARDLKPGHRIHTVTGTVEVAGIEEVPTEPTFNLVVDGFHTYFVGNGKALCHDVSLASPTDAVVPGLID